MEIDMLQSSEFEGEPVPKEIFNTLNYLYDEDDVIELRILNAGKEKTVSGYFNDFKKCAKYAAYYSGSVPGVYITANPVNKALLARANNKVIKWAKATTSDNEIQRRKYFLIDFDPIRPSGISSTDEEHELSLSKAQVVDNWLQQIMGWPEGIYADSGNGAHLLYLIDLPSDEESIQLIKKCLMAIEVLHSDKAISVDLTVYNASRIWKLYGTKACKGEDLPERPHRKAQLLRIPEKKIKVTVDQLKALANMIPARSNKMEKSADNSNFDIKNWIDEHNLEVTREKEWNGSKLYELHHCPFDSNHVNSARIIKMENGALSFGCFHNSCSDFNWKTLRDKLDPQRKDAQSLNTPQESFHLTDLGNSERLVSLEGEDIRYSYESKKWLIWNGIYWEYDKTGEIFRKSKNAVRSIYLEAAVADDSSQRTALSSWANESEENARINAMIKGAQSEPGVPVTMAQMNSDNWLLNCLNGTLNLKTFELEKHKRVNYITLLAPVEYIPGARSEVFDKFLERVIPSEEIREFIQKGLGYSITGDISEEKLFFIFGPPASGKSTLLAAISKVLGGYSATADFEAFLDRGKATGGARNDIARLAGKRFVQSIEVGEGQKMAESLVKSLTGGDTITARFLYQEYFEFLPTFKLWLAANFKPRISENDDAMWRRILPIGFTEHIPEDERDPNIKKRLTDITDCGPAILNWLVEGCRKWQEEGLKTPDSVKEAILEYKEEMDPLKEFLADSCIINPLARVDNTQLWAEYENWCRDNGERFLLGRKKFTQKLLAKGYTQERGASKRYWKGLGLLANRSRVTHVTHDDTKNSKAVSIHTYGGNLSNKTSQESQVSFYPTNITTPFDEGEI